MSIFYLMYFVWFIKVSKWIVLLFVTLQAYILIHPFLVGKFFMLILHIVLTGIGLILPNNHPYFDHEEIRRTGELVSNIN